jgi:hypothetical protein
MGAHWKTAMREHGFDPKIVVDAPKRIGIVEAIVELLDMKGAIIGDGCNCSGARCLRRKLGAILAKDNIQGDLFVYLGASRAIVAWRSKTGKQTGFRFLVNGLPKQQDRTMNVVGERIALRPPVGTKKTTGRTQGSKKTRSTKSGVTTGRNSTGLSLAAQLRSVA